MSTILIAGGAFIAYLIAYHTYGRWISRNIFGLDPQAMVPSQELRDDVDFVPTRKEVIFGHHFTSIAGTGPVSRNSLVYSTRAAASLSQYFLSRRDSVGLVTYGDEIVSVDRDTGKKQLYVLLTKLAGAMAKGNTPLKVVTDRIMPHINRGSPVIIMSPLEDDPTVVNAVRDLRSRNFDVTILSPSSLEFEFDARRLDRTGYEVLKTERDILLSELRGLGANVMDWEPDMLLNTALTGARGF